MSEELPNIPHTRHAGSSPFARAVPFLVWIGAVGLIAWLFASGGSYDQINGVVDFKLESVASLDNGKVEHIFVEVDHRVKKGDPLIQMDTSLLDEEIEAIRQSLNFEKLERERRFTTMVQDIRTDIRATALQQSQDQAELNVLEVELKRLEELLAQKLIDRETVIRQKSRVAVLEKNLVEYPKILAAFQADLKQSEALSREALKSSANPGDTKEDSERLDYLMKRKERYTLRAANNGTVARLFHQKGEIIAGGEAILKLIIGEYNEAGQSTKTVRGFLPEKYAHYAEKGNEATVYPVISPDSMVKMKVVSVTPNVVAIPDQASALPNSVQRGRFILLRPMEGEPQTHIDKLLHGESVVIRVKPKTWLDILKQI